MTGEDGMMITVTNPWDISAKDVSTAPTQQYLPFVGSEPWRLTWDSYFLEGFLKSAFQCILSDRERNFSHEGDTFIYPHLLQSNKSFGI